MFDYKLLIHAPNTIAKIMYEIKLARMPISLQWIFTVSMEKKFGKMSMHASIRQTAVEPVKTIEDDEAMQFIYVQDQIKTSGWHTAKRSRLYVSDWDRDYAAHLCRSRHPHCRISGHHFTSYWRDHQGRIPHFR
jgi:hypothetical protein